MKKTGPALALLGCLAVVAGLQVIARKVRPENERTVTRGDRAPSDLKRARSTFVGHGPSMGPPSKRQNLLNVPFETRRQPAEADVGPAATELAPELQGLWPHEIEKRRLDDFRRIQTEMAADYGLPEAYRARYVEIMLERRKGQRALADKLELFELTPDDHGEASEAVEREMRAKRKALFAEAGIEEPRLGGFSGGSMVTNQATAGAAGGFGAESR